jgi:hypothetical protein
MKFKNTFASRAYGDFTGSYPGRSQMLCAVPRIQWARADVSENERTAAEAVSRAAVAKTLLGAK